jgi:Fe-S-cluster-containing hydrogenase component 2
MEPEQMLRPEYMRLDSARCIHCELCYLVAPVIAADPERIPVSVVTLAAMAACPCGAIVWKEEGEADET